MSRHQFKRWRKIFLGVRAQVLIWYVVLMSASALVSTSIIRDRLFARLQARTERSLQEEVSEFRRFIQELQAEQGDGESSTQNGLDELFDSYLTRNVPSREEFYIAILETRFYGASTNALPAPLQANSPLIRTWGTISQPTQGEVDTPLGSVVYRAEPVQLNQDRGVLVVTRFIDPARAERNAEVIIVIEATIAVLVIASALAWLAAGRALTPLRSLTKTARSITGSAMTRRIPVHGDDEIGELTRTFNEMLDRLEAAFNNQRNFLNDVGHELRTPLTIIRGHLELMGDDPHEKQETLALVFDEIERMNRLVADLLLLARTKQHDFLKVECLDTQTFTAELYAKVKTLADRNWELTVQGTTALLADRQRLTQAIVNLVYNATQYTEPGQTIEIGSAMDEHSARFWVRDTGVGIAYDDQNHIFDRFARASTAKRHPEGTGLGLSIVRAIAEAHAGTVTLLSHPGQGSTFTIIIPTASSLDHKTKDA